jgi:hypothetical protein
MEKFMKIYTTYFANLKKLPKEIVPVSICGKCPEGFKGAQYKKLAPKYDFFMEWKKNNDNDYYKKCFNEQVLSNLDAGNVYQDLHDIAENFVNTLPDDDIRKQHQQLGFPYIVALICYEEPNDFCHRHLVANWLTSNDIKCVEWEFYSREGM